MASKLNADDFDAEDGENSMEDEEYEQGKQIYGNVVPAWLLPVVTRLPFLSTTCPFGTVHWAWTRLCMCGFGELDLKSSDDVNDGDGDDSTWHGGIYDLKYHHELQPCAECFDEYSPFNHQWSLSDDEERLLLAWREYKTEMLTPLGDETPFKWEISVELNDLRSTLTSGARGLPTLSETRGLFANTKRSTKNSKPN